MQVLQLFPPVFAVFRPFLHRFLYFWPPWPHLPGGTRSRNTETGGREPQNPLGGGEKNHAPGGEPGRAQHSAGAGDGLPPPSQGRSAAQRQRGGTRRGRAAGGGGDRRERAATGSRAAQRRGRPAAGRPPGGAGTTHRPPPTPQTRRTGDARLAKKALCAGRLPQMLRAAGPPKQAGGGCGPPQSAEPAGPNAATPPRDGGGPPPPGPTLQVCRAWQTTHWPPGPRWQMAGRRRDRISICSAILYPLRLIHSRLSEGAEMRPLAAGFPCDRATPWTGASAGRSAGRGVDSVGRPIIQQQPIIGPPLNSIRPRRPRS